MSSQTLLNVGADKQYRSKYNDPNYQGEPVDPRLANGPLENRSCTDLLCFFLFIAFWVAVIFMTGAAFKKGDPERLLHGFDYSGNQCGGPGDFKEHTMIYFGYPFPSDKGDYKSSLGRTVCVKSCPTFAFGEQAPTSLECKTNELYTDCQTTQDPTQTSKLYVYSSMPVMNLFCLPYDGTLAKTIQDVTNIGMVSAGIREVEKNYTSVLIVAGIALVISFIYMFLVRSCAKLLVWLIIVLYFVGLCFLGYFFFQKREDYEKRTDLTQEESLKWQKIMIALAYGTWGLAALSLALVCCWFQKIQIVTEVLAAAAEYVSSETLTLLLPPIFFVLSMGFLAYWFATLAYLWTSGERADGHNLPFGGWKWSDDLRNMIYFHVFSLFWNVSFIISLLQFVLASSAVLWYFRRRSPYFKSNETVVSSLWISVRYHLGTVACGALILSIAKMIKVLYAYIYYTLKKDGLVETTSVKYLATCCACCLEAFERFIRFINTHGFIETALTGKNFCEAASDGFYLFTRNAATFGLSQGLGNAFVIIGKVFITVASVFLGHMLLTKVPHYSANVIDGRFLLFLFGLVSYIIAGIFMEIWGMATDAILHSFLVDHEVHRSSGLKAKNCPDGLRSVIGH